MPVRLTRTQPGARNTPTASGRHSRQGALHLGLPRQGMHDSLSLKGATMMDLTRGIVAHRPETIATASRVIVLHA